MNEWWEAGDIPEGLTDARVVHIVKKGRTSDFENYRPILLLNTFYKIFAAIMKDRMGNGLDKHIQTVQFGFMKGRSTLEAIQMVRRVLEQGERSQEKSHKTGTV